MNPLESTDVPHSFTVAVMMQKRPSPSRWLDASWRVTAVVSGHETIPGRTLVHQDGEVEEYLCSGLTLRLYKDEAESYYHNLMAPHPSLYVILRPDGAGIPTPFQVSACFDEAQAYLESDGDAQPVALPADLYGPIEHFVLSHYVPERRSKRQRQNWHQE